MSLQVTPEFLPLVLHSSFFCSAILKILHVGLIELFYFIVALKFLTFPSVLAKYLLSLKACLVGKRSEGGHGKQS